MEEERIDLEKITLIFPNLDELDPTRSVFINENESPLLEIIDPIPEPLPENDVIITPLSRLENEIENISSDIIHVVEEIIESISESKVQDEKIEEIQDETIKEIQDETIKEIQDETIKEIQDEKIEEIQEEIIKENKKSGFLKILSTLFENISNKFIIFTKKEINHEIVTDKKDIKILESVLQKKLEEIQTDDIAFSNTISPLFVCICNKVNVVVDMQNENIKSGESNEDENLPGLSFVSDA